MAIHESSHAVVAHRLGFRVTAISERFVQRDPPPGAALDPATVAWHSTLVTLAGLCGVGRLAQERHDIDVSEIFSSFNDDLVEVYRAYAGQLLSLPTPEPEGNSTGDVGAVGSEGEAPSLDDEIVAGMKGAGLIWLSHGLEEARALVASEWATIQAVAERLQQSSTSPWTIPIDEFLELVHQREGQSEEP